jgi:hypothetical protein
MCLGGGGGGGSKTPALPAPNHPASIPVPDEADFAYDPPKTTGSNKQPTKNVNTGLEIPIG